MRELVRLAVVVFFHTALCSAARGGAKFEISFDKGVASGPITRRAALIIARSDRPEPRFQIAPDTTPVFGVDLDNLPRGQPAIIDSTTFGHPVERLSPWESSNVQPRYEFFQSWTSDGFPRFLLVTFVDGYGVNSANNGPYGDALTRELIPEVEKQFRAIGKLYARPLEGASTGGRESLALQLKYPDFFGGAWVVNPDRIDFRRDQLINIYEDEDARSLRSTGRVFRLNARCVDQRGDRYRSIDFPFSLIICY